MKTANPPPLMNHDPLMLEKLNVIFAVLMVDVALTLALLFSSLFWLLEIRDRVAELHRESLCNRRPR